MTFESQSSLITTGQGSGMPASMQRKPGFFFSRNALGHDLPGNPGEYEAPLPLGKAFELDVQGFGNVVCAPQSILNQLSSVQAK